MGWRAEMCRVLLFISKYSRYSPGGLRIFKMDGSISAEQAVQIKFW